jgi:hypothetical protein
MPRHTADSLAPDNRATLVLPLRTGAFGILALPMLKSLADFRAIPHGLGYLLRIHRLPQSELRRQWSHR